MAATSDRGNTPVVVVVVALVGLLSTVAASALSASAASSVADSQFWNQRTAEVIDQRRAVYADFLRAALAACVIAKTGDDAKLDKAASDLLDQQARVLLIGGTEVGNVASDFTEAVAFAEGPKNACTSNDLLKQQRTAFVKSAQNDLKSP
jgi:hypothetical protein